MFGDFHPYSDHSVVPEQFQKPNSKYLLSPIYKIHAFNVRKIYGLYLTHLLYFLSKTEFKNTLLFTKTYKSLGKNLRIMLNTFYLLLSKLAYLVFVFVFRGFS